MENPKKEFKNLKFSISRSVRYHVYRESFFRAIINVGFLVSFLFSTASIVTIGEVIAKDWPTWAKLIPSASISVVTSFVFVFRVTDRMRLHGDLRKEFVELQKEMELNSNLDENQLIDFVSAMQTKRLDIELKEPRVLKVLDIFCHNEIMRSQGQGPEDEGWVVIPFYKKVMKQWIDIGESDLHPQKTTPAA